MPAIEFCHWIKELGDLLGYTPEAGGVEEEFLKDRYYSTGVSATKTYYQYRLVLQGPPAKERRIHF